MAHAMKVELDAQYRQLREDCGLLDPSERGKLMLSGSGAAEFLQGQLTNEIEALEVGDGTYAALLDRKGHVQADMRVLRPGADELWGDTEATALETAGRPPRPHKIGRGVAIPALTAERPTLSLIGPRSADLAGTPPLLEHACAN